VDSAVNQAERANRVSRHWSTRTSRRAAGDDGERLSLDRDSHPDGERYLGPGVTGLTRDKELPPPSLDRIVCQFSLPDPILPKSILGSYAGVCTRIPRSDRHEHILTLHAPKMSDRPFCHDVDWEECVVDASGLGFCTRFTTNILV
jgi:hypothetical protein